MCMYRLLLEVYANIYTGLVFGVCVLVLQGPFDEQNLIFLSLLTSRLWRGSNTPSNRTGSVQQHALKCLVGTLSQWIISGHFGRK